MKSTCSKWDKLIFIQEHFTINFSDEPVAFLFYFIYLSEVSLIYIMYICYYSIDYNYIENCVHV